MAKSLFYVAKSGCTKQNTMEDDESSNSSRASSDAEDEQVVGNGKKSRTRWPKLRVETIDARGVKSVYYEFLEKKDP